MIGDAALSAYAAVGRLVEPAAGLMLRRRERRGLEDRTRLGERFGRTCRPRLPGPVIWMHASSMGETSAALALVDRIGARGSSLILTTNALAGFKIAESRLGERIVHQFAPIDTPVPVNRFLDHWQPDLALFVESELWPTMLNGLKKRGTPLLLVSARMSERAFRDWRRLGPMARAVSSRLDLVFAQSEADAARFRQIGAGAVRVCGNLKFDVPPPKADDRLLSEMRVAIGSRHVFLAASTHPGEEAAVLSAHAALARSGVALLTIIAPRHPGRGAELATAAESAGLSAALRSRGQAVDAGTQVYIADTVGEMGLWYRVADLALLGGSLVPRGGQSPIEPAQLGVAVLHGRHVENFHDIYGALDGAGGARSLPDAALLGETVRQLLADPAERLGMAGHGRACVARFTGALERTMVALEPYLARLEAQRCG